MSDLSLLRVAGIGEVRAGEDLAAVILAGCGYSGITLAPGDVVCVSSKIVSKSLGLWSGDRAAAISLGTRAVVAVRATPRGITSIVRAVAGPVMAAAGVDESNTGPGGGVLRLPDDPDDQARRLRRDIAAGSGFAAGSHRPAVVITDTAGRPWRDGQIDFALGVAGLRPVDDARGSPDADGRVMDVTVRALADEVAAAADLVKGKVTATPVAVVRGLAALVTAEDGPGAARLLREPGTDWFGRGDVEAVHAALGMSEAAAATVRAEHGPPPAALPGDPADTLRRAVAVARLARDGEVTAHIGDPEHVDGRWRISVAGDPVAVGRALERVITAAAAERVVLAAEPSGESFVAARWQLVC